MRLKSSNLAVDELGPIGEYGDRDNEDLARHGKKQQFKVWSH